MGFISQSAVTRGHAVPWPRAQRDRERALHRILGDVDVPENTGQSGNRPAGPSRKMRPTAASSSSSRTQSGAPGSVTNGLTSMGAPMSAVTFDAQDSAAFKSAASMM